LSTDDREDLDQKARECSAAMNTPGWRLLVAEFESRTKRATERIMRPATTDFERRDEVMREAGRQDVLGWFASIIRDREEHRGR